MKINNATNTDSNEPTIQKDLHIPVFLSIKNWEKATEKPDIILPNIIVGKR